MQNIELGQQKRNGSNTGKADSTAKSNQIKPDGVADAQVSDKQQAAPGAQPGKDGQPIAGQPGAGAADDRDSLNNNNNAKPISKSNTFATFLTYSDCLRRRA